MVLFGSQNGVNSESVVFPSNRWCVLWTTCDPIVRLSCFQPPSPEPWRRWLAGSWRSPSRSRWEVAVSSAPTWNSTWWVIRFLTPVSLVYKLKAFISFATTFWLFLHGSCCVVGDRWRQEVPEAAGAAGSLPGDGLSHHLCGQAGARRRPPQRPDEGLLPLHVSARRSGHSCILDIY